MYSALTRPVKYSWRVCFFGSLPQRSKWRTSVAHFTYTVMPGSKCLLTVCRHSSDCCGNTYLLCLTYILSPSWEAANCATTQELSSILCNPKVHYRAHKSPPLVPILSQIDPVHTILSYLSTIYFNIVHPLTSSFPSGLFPSGLPNKIPQCTGSSAKLEKKKSPNRTWTHCVYAFLFSPFVLHTLLISSSLTWSF
jgi:hypothetical protein